MGTMPTPVAKTGVGDAGDASYRNSTGNVHARAFQGDSLPHDVALEERPCGDARHKRYGIADGQNADLRQGREIKDLQRAGRDDRAARVGVVEASVPCEPPRETTPVLPTPKLSVTLRWPGPVRTQSL